MCFYYKAPTISHCQFLTTTLALATGIKVPNLTPVIASPMPILQIWSIKVYVRKGTDLMNVMEKVCWVKGPKVFQHLVSFSLFPTFNLSLIPSINKVSQSDHRPMRNFICWCVLRLRTIRCIVDSRKFYLRCLLSIVSIVECFNN